MADTSPADLVVTRLGAAVLGAALAGLAVWISLLNLRLPTRDGWIFWVPLTLLLVTTAVLCWWFALSGHQAASRASIRASWRAGWTVGAVSLAAGVAGPLVITPEASLGPLLGILLTGPLGFVLGVVGAVVARAGRGSP
jgi:hypothetical protein